jgi:hypothetical protein
MQIKINTQLIDWAIERSAKSVDDLMRFESPAKGKRLTELNSRI